MRVKFRLSKKVRLPRVVTVLDEPGDEGKQASREWIFYAKNSACC